MKLFNHPLCVAIGILACICMTLFLRLQTLHERTLRLQQTFSQERSASNQRQHIIEQLQQQITNLNEQQQRSAEAQADLERLAQNRLVSLRKLEDENSHLRQWADHRLPTELGGLRDRDGLSGASAYQQHLRNP